MGSKTCTGCGKSKQINEFVKCGKKFRKTMQVWKQQFRAQCKGCWAELERKRYDIKKEAFKKEVS